MKERTNTWHKKDKNNCTRWYCSLQPMQFHRVYGDVQYSTLQNFKNVKTLFQKCQQIVRSKKKFSSC